MSAEALKIREKGPAVWIAMAGFILCVVSSAGLIVMLIGPQSFRSLPAVAHLLAAAGLLPASAMRQAAPVSGAWNDAARIGARPWGQARYGVQGAAERDATERPRVPGWDPVVHLPAADLADLDPDQVVDRALGQVPDDDAFAPVPALTAGQSTPIRSAAGAPSADVAARRAVAATGSPAAEAAGSPRVGRCCMDRQLVRLGRSG